MIGHKKSVWTVGRRYIDRQKIYKSKDYRESVRAYLDDSDVDSDDEFDTQNAYEKLDLQDWTQEHVQNWLKVNGFQAIAQPFGKKKIDGVKLATLTEQDLREQFRVEKWDERKQFLIALNKVRK